MCPHFDYATQGLGAPAEEQLELQQVGIGMPSCFCRKGGSAARQRTGQHAGDCSIGQNGGDRKKLRWGLKWFWGLGLGLVRRAHAMDGGMGSLEADGLELRGWANEQTHRRRLG